MKVSLFGTLPPLKGISVYCWSLARGLADRQPVEFFTFRRLYPDWLYPGGTRDDDPEWTVAPSPQLTIHSTLTWYNPLSWLLSALKAGGDLIHAQWWSLPVAPVWWVILRILRWRGRRVLITVHNVELHEKGFLDRMAMKAVFALADAFCVHCSANADRLSEQMGIEKNRIHVVPFPLYDMYSGERISRSEARRHLDIRDDRKVVLLFGNIRKYKGVDVFLRAAAGLSQGQKENLCILIVGQIWTDASELDDLITECGLAAQVKKFLEYVPMSDVKYYFEASDLAALPYKHFEAQSGVGSIALAFGKPLLVTRVGGLTDLVKRPEAIAEPDDVESLRGALAGLLEDDGLLEQLAADSRSVAGERTWDAVAERTLEIYRTVMDKQD